MTTIDWNTGGLRGGFTTYQQKVMEAIRRIQLYWAAVFEQYAKENAPWTDRTANARQSLHTFVEDLAADTVALYLSHGMEYGLYLETRYAGAYAIIWPTIEAHIGAVRKMLQEVFG